MLERKSLNVQESFLEVFEGRNVWWLLYWVKKTFENVCEL